MKRQQLHSCEAARPGFELDSPQTALLLLRVAWSFRCHIMEALLDFACHIMEAFLAAKM